MNRNKFFAVLMIVAGAMMLNSCKKERTVLNGNGGDLYQAYFPTELGKYIIYDVDSSIWDNTTCLKYSRKSQHEYLVADTFRDAQNRLSYVINIRTRLTPTDSWSVSNVIYYTPAAEQLEVVEKNIRFMRLVNPVSEGHQWLGNSLLPQEDHDFDWLKGWKYTYSKVQDQYNNGALNFDKTVTVTEVNDVVSNPETYPDAYASLLQSKAVYAYRIGMIYKEFVYWTYDAIPGQKNCRQGVGVVMRAVEYN